MSDLHSQIASVCENSPGKSAGVTAVDAAVDFGTLVLSQSQSTLPAGVDDTQVITNTGNYLANIKIKGANTTEWILADKISFIHYVLEFSIDGGDNWIPLTTDYQLLKASVPPGGTINLDLRITIPSMTKGTVLETGVVTIESQGATDSINFTVAINYP